MTSEKWEIREETIDMQWPGVLDDLPKVGTRISYRPKGSHERFHDFVLFLRGKDSLQEVVESFHKDNGPQAWRT